MLHSDSSLFSGHTNMDHCLALGDTGPGVRALVGREAQGRGEGKSGEGQGKSIILFKLKMEMLAHCNISN